MGYASSQDYDIHLAADIRSKGGYVFRYAEAEALQEEPGVAVTGISHGDHGPEVIRPEIGYCSSVPHKLLLYLILGIFPAEAHLHKGECRDSPGTLRTQRPVSPEGVIGIYDTPSSMQGN